MLVENPRSAEYKIPFLSRIGNYISAVIHIAEQPTFSNWLLQVPTAAQVGMLSFQSVPPELQILRLAILPDWRKQGLAQFMLKQLEIVAKSANVESLWLEVNSANKAATALYYKQGYQETGIRKNYFINPLGDALLLKKILKYDDKQASQ